MLSALLAVAVQAALAAAPEQPKVDERAGLEPTEQVRLSLPTEDDVQAWSKEGLRLSLGAGYRGLFGSGPALGLSQFGFALRPWVRLDRYWSVATTFQFGASTEGLAWSGTVEPTFHPLSQLGLSLGVGYGGLSLAVPSRGPLPAQAETVSRTLTDGTLLSGCTGSALVTLTRAEYLFVAGPLFSTGPYAQLHAQWTACEKVISPYDPETGREAVLTQWWRQQGLSFGWWLTWR